MPLGLQLHSKALQCLHSLVAHQTHFQVLAQNEPLGSSQHLAQLHQPAHRILYHPHWDVLQLHDHSHDLNPDHIDHLWDIPHISEATNHHCRIHHLWAAFQELSLIVPQLLPQDDCPCMGSFVCNVHAVYSCNIVYGTCP